MTETPQPSIHHQRRWFYALWSGLLLAGLGAYGLWLTPARVEQPRFGLVVHPARLPEGVSVQVWAGPEARWSAAVSTGEAGFQSLGKNAEGRFGLSPVPLPFAVRRWVPRTLILSRSHDLVVLRFTDPAGSRRFLFLTLRDDWQQGTLRDQKRVYYSLHPVWEALGTDGGLPADLR